MLKGKSSNLKIAMFKAGYTGAALAKELEISQSYMSLILTEKTTLSAPLAKRICSALHADFDLLFRIEGVAPDGNNQRNR